MPERIALPGADLRWWPDFLKPAAQRSAHDMATAELPWQQRDIHLFGRPIAEPRLTSWHGDPTAHYRYSGRDNQPQPWTAWLLRLRDEIGTATGASFNCVLANMYRDGRDHMGWHSDDEPELGGAPLIASLSLGSVRRLQFRPRPKGPIALSIDLPPGSLLVMASETQSQYHHRVAPTARPVGARINLTFRSVAGIRR